MFDKNKFDFDVENLKKEFQIEKMNLSNSDIENLRKYSNKEITINDMINDFKNKM